MEALLNKAKQLFDEKKYKKALNTVKKINKKPLQQTFESLELEGICLAHEKMHQLSVITFNKALLRAKNNEEKLRTYWNLKSVSISLKKYGNACTFLKRSLDIDGSPSNAEARYLLCQLSFEIHDYDTIINYSEKLFSLSEYALDAMILYCRAQVEKDNSSVIHSYINKLIAQLDTLTSVQSQNLLICLVKSDNKKDTSIVLQRLTVKFGHQPWHQKSLASLVNKKSNSDTLGKKTLNLIAEDAPIIEGQIINADIEQAFTSKNQVIGDNLIVINLIKQLITTLEKKGAFFNKKMQITEKSGNLSINAFTSKDEAKKLISVPLNCMPLLVDYNLSIDANSQIIVTHKKNMLNSHAKEIMLLIVDIYNATDKLAVWQEELPFFSLKNCPKMLKHLCSTCPDFEKIRKFEQLSYENKDNELLIESFIASRYFAFPADSLGKSGIKTKNIMEEGLLPIIDFLNHNDNALGGYHIDNKSQHMEITSIPSASNEIFVRYNRYDAMMTYLHYGFVDTNVPWLYSTAIELKALSGLIIKILNVPQPVAQNKSLEHQHLQAYYPSVIERQGDMIVMCSLILPGSQDYGTFNQVISAILTQYDNSGLYENSASLNNEVHHISTLVLRKNYFYWLEMQKILATTLNISAITRKSLESLSSISLDKVTSLMKKLQISPTL